MQVGQDFVDAADVYVRKFLNNGVPSLFSDLKPLYRQEPLTIQQHLKLCMTCVQNGICCHHYRLCTKGQIGVLHARFACIQRAGMCTPWT